MAKITRVIIILFFSLNSLSAQTIHNLVLLNTSKARPLGMGGAFFSLQDDLPAIDYNPASFQLYNRIEGGGKFSFFVSPIGIMVRGWQANQQSLSKSQWVESAPLLLKAVFYSRQRFDVGLLISEEIIDSTDYIRLKKGIKNSEVESQFFQAANHHAQIFHNALIVKFQLAEKVLFGITTSILVHRTHGKNNIFASSSYGLLLKPRANLNVGIVYNNIPKPEVRARQTEERIDDETINLGISYRPVTIVILSLDIRNTSEESKIASKEIHLGSELNCWGWFAVRAGFYQFSNDSKHLVYSAGFGFFDLNNFRSKENRYGHPDFVLDYAITYKTGFRVTPITHYLTIQYNF